MIATTFVFIFLTLCALGILVAILLPDDLSPVGLVIIGSVESIALLTGSGATLFDGAPIHLPRCTKASSTSTRATSWLRCFAYFSWVYSYEAAADIGYSRQLGCITGGA
jgi:hypothetical protein